jgi:hypothetical protein
VTCPPKARAGGLVGGYSVAVMQLGLFFEKEKYCYFYEKMIWVQLSLKLIVIHNVFERHKNIVNLDNKMKI